MWCGFQGINSGASVYRNLVGMAVWCGRMWRVMVKGNSRDVAIQKGCGGVEYGLDFKILTVVV